MLRLPKLPKLNSKVVGVLVVAAVLVLVFAAQKTPDGFQNSPLSILQAQELLMTAQKALASGVTELNSLQERVVAAQNKLNVKEQELRAATAAVAEMKNVVLHATNEVKRAQIDLELKQKAVQMAEQALEDAKRAAVLPLPPEQPVPRPQVPQPPLHHPPEQPLPRPQVPQPPLHHPPQQQRRRRWFEWW